ncbi:hypothetical protein GF406_12175 [candidate division KSB1 bacterium]|nr:hypothetical protein [candidate division KSB1 bacterium]
MIDKSPEMDQWKELYELMIELKSLSPWKWLEEHHVFGVENPETNEIGFVSVMGAVEEHYSVAVYLGEEGLEKFWDFQENPIDDFAFQRLMEIPQLQASFEERDYLYEEDRKIIKKLGFAFRGKQAWPMFRSYSPGFVPWFLSSNEARFLIHVLQQTLDVSVRAKENPAILEPKDEGSYLLRKPFQNGDKIQWQDTIWHEPALEPETYDVSMDTITIERYNHLDINATALEIDIFMSPSSVHEKNSKPYFPYVIIILETTNGIILDHKLVPPIPNLKSMWEQVPYTILNMLIKSSMKPEKVYVHSELLYKVLDVLKNNIDLPVILVKELHFAKEAKLSFIEFLQR